jgi:hypothetical protein
MTHTVYLSRRNLLSLLTKLDRVKAGGSSVCAIVKNDQYHAAYPQSLPDVVIQAVEDEDYYSDRAPGVMIEDVDATLSKKVSTGD